MFFIVLYTPRKLRYPVGYSVRQRAATLGYLRELRASFHDFPQACRIRGHKEEEVTYATISLYFLLVYKLHWHIIWYQIYHHVTPYARHCICHRLLSIHNLHHHHHHHSSYRYHHHVHDHRIDVCIVNEIYQGLRSFNQHLYEPYSGLGISFLNEFASSARETRDSGFCHNGHPLTQLLCT